MRKIAFTLVLLCLAHLDLTAQGAATFHVFPQVADGLIGASAYLSSLSAINVSNQPAACTYRLYGGVASRISGSPTFTLPVSGSFMVVNTVVADAIVLPLATGYGTLTCSQPVTATVSYVNVAVPSATVLAGAAVFSSPPTTRAELLAYQFAGFRTAIALANDTDSPAQYQVAAFNASGQQVGTASVSVPARSNTPKYVDEIMTLPINLNIGAVVITGSTPFSVVGLIFNGAVFISQPAALFGP